MPPKKLRIGTVGFGFMGKMHAHACRSLGFYFSQPPARIEFAGVATRTEASYRTAVEEWGYEWGTTDFRELCASPGIDIVDCCVPNHLHKDVLIAALEKGKHVYMDKPLCCSLDDAREMAACAAAHPECVTQMTFQNRFIPAMIRAKQLVDGDALGRIFSVRVCYLHAGYADPNRPFSWRVDAAKSGPGGALFDLGAHVVDLVLHLFGPISEVNHLAETFVKERPLPGDPATKAPVEVDDLSIVMFRLREGGVGTIESSRLATGVQDEIRVEAHGSKGAIRFNLMQPNFLEFYDATETGGDYGGERGFKAIECVARYPKPATLPGPKNTVGWDRFHVQCMYNFLSHVAAGKPAQPDILAGARTQAVLEAAVQSGNTRAWTLVEDV